VLLTRAVSVHVNEINELEGRTEAREQKGTGNTVKPVFSRALYFANFASLTSLRK